MRLVFMLLLLLAPIFAQEPAPEPQSPEPDHEDWLQKEVGLEQMFRNPPDRFASLLFNRIDTVKVNGVGRIRYSLSSAGLEPGKHYLFMAWELGSDAPQLLLPAVQVDDKGVLHCDPENKECPGGPGSEINVAVSDKPGQPSRFVIADQDEKPIALGEVIPNPSSVNDHDCTLETILLRPDATIALVIGKGFDPGEDIKVISTSFDEHVANAGKADEQGAYQTVLLPFAKDHDSGDTMVTMNGAKCELSTQYAWGTPKPTAAEPAVAGEHPQESAPAAAPSGAAETVISPIRTATDQIQRAIAEQAAAAQAAKEAPEERPAAGPEPPDAASAEGNSEENAPPETKPSSEAPAESQPSDSGSPEPTSKPGGPSTAPEPSPNAEEPTSSAAQPPSADEAREPQEKPTAEPEDKAPKPSESAPSTDAAPGTEAPAVPENPTSEAPPDTKAAPPPDESAPDADTAPPPADESAPKETSPAEPPTDEAPPTAPDATPAPPPTKPDAPEQTPQT